MLSSKAKYALRSILRLAECAPTRVWLQTNDVAERERVPRKFLEAIFVQLHDHGLIGSRRGAQGGRRFLRVSGCRKQPEKRSFAHGLAVRHDPTSSVHRQG
jgi:Rrf2 family protein